MPEQPNPMAETLSELFPKARSRIEFLPQAAAVGQDLTPRNHLRNTHSRRLLT
jgi:hypothetical protein